MFLVLGEDERIVMNDKIMFIDAFRRLYNKHKSDQDLVGSYFLVIYYMYHFKSPFVWKYRDDEVERLKQVRKFIHRGNEVKVCQTMRKAMDVTKELMEFESSALYTTMRDSIEKLKQYLDVAVLYISPDAADEDIAGAVVIDPKVHKDLVKSIPEHWNSLSKFEKELTDELKQEIDIYGGGNKGAFE